MFEAGVDVEWAADKYEVESLVELEAAWTQETEIESCNDFAQNFISGNFGNNFVADNSVLFRVDTGKKTYMNVTRNSLGIGITGGCDSTQLASCGTLFNPNGSQYDLQTVGQIKKPQPNNALATDDKELERQYGAAIDAAFPNPGNPSSYPAETAGEPTGCAPAAQRRRSGATGIVDTNPVRRADHAPAAEPARGASGQPGQSVLRRKRGRHELLALVRLDDDEYVIGRVQRGQRDVGQDRGRQVRRQLLPRLGHLDDPVVLQWYRVQWRRVRLHRLL